MPSFPQLIQNTTLFLSSLGFDTMYALNDNTPAGIGNTACAAVLGILLFKICFVLTFLIFKQHVHIMTDSIKKDLNLEANPQHLIQVRQLFFCYFNKNKTKQHK
jgi:hypothetical protein